MIVFFGSVYTRWVLMSYVFCNNCWYYESCLQEADFTTKCTLRFITEDFLRNINYVHLQHNLYSALIVSRHFARCAQMKQCTECTLLYYKNVCTSLLISDRCQHLNWRRLCIVLFPFARLAWLFLANLMRSLCVYNNNYLTYHICLIQESISCV